MGMAETGVHFLYFLVGLPLWCVCSETSERPFSYKEDPAFFYTMIELICSEGYYVQEHTVVTEDGYILALFRIPGGKRRPKTEKKKTHYAFVHRNYHPDFEDCVRESRNLTFSGPVVLFSHGVAAASDSWVLQGPKNDLAYMTVDEGYDVWFSNIRGNFYSTGHKPPRLPDKLYWDFSFHENGVYDMTAVIDYILNYTGSRKLQYVGHSMGTTMFFVMAATRPEYNQKIQLFVALTPVAHMRRESYSSSKKAILDMVFRLCRAYANNGVYFFLPRNNLINWVVKILCSKDSPNWIQNLCYDLSFFFTGYSSKLLKREKLPVYLCHGFSGNSIKTFHHFAQLLEGPAFRNYDYGPEENIRRYGQAEPPDYDLGKVTTPTALFYSKGDYVSDHKDVENLKTFLPNVIASDENPVFNHIDYLWAYTAKDTIYPKVIDLINKFRNQ